MATLLDQHRCTYTTRQGNRCRNRRLRDSTVCFFHNTRVPRALALGEILKNRDLLDTAEGIHHVLASTLRALAEGQIPIGRATAITYIAQTMLANLRRLQDDRRTIYIKEEDQARQDTATIDATIDDMLGQPQDAATPK